MYLDYLDKEMYFYNNNLVKPTITIQSMQNNQFLQ